MHATRIIKALMRTSFCGLKLISHLNKEINANKLLWLKIIKILEQKIQNMGKKFKNSRTKITKIWETKLQKSGNKNFKNQGTKN
jgi:hypothetical protein